MRLAEFEPRWATLNNWSSDDPFYVGLSFLCPCCRVRRLAVRFNTEIDPLGLRARYGWTWRPEEPTWLREGEAFDTLTLSPSIDFSRSGHWHGHIANGEVINA